VNSSNGKFVQVTAGNNSSGALQTAGRMTFNFTASAAGDYRVWGRNIAPTTSDDSWWVQMDGKTAIKWNDILASTTFQWSPVHDSDNAKTVVTFNLTAGPHTLVIGYREDGTKLDRILITNDLTFTPTGVGPPSPPTGLTATAGNNQVSLRWTASAGTTSYTVNRGIATGGPYPVRTTGVAGTTFQDNTATNGTRFCYVVTAVNALGESGNSNEACATPVSTVSQFTQAEAFSLGSSLQVVNDTTASGGKFIQAVPGKNSTGAAPASDGRASLSFTVPVAGLYKVWGLVQAPTTSHDSWWVRMDAAATFINWNGIPAGTAWHWAPVHDSTNGNQVVQFNLTAGTHTLELAYREDGTKLDRVLITNDLALVPTGQGP
jgi:hypothetical protein